MDKKAQFYEYVKSEMMMTLATAAGESVTMRVVSPVYHNGDILIFSSSSSLKYKQLADNPNCAIAIGPFFVQAKAKLMGKTMLDCNKELREAYAKKFPGAFDEGVEYGGREDDFILLTPTRLTGWGFKDGIPTADGVPNAPFDILL